MAANRQAACAWIIEAQLGRRNVTPEQRSYLIGKRYNAEKGGRGGDRKSNHHFDGLKNHQDVTITDAGTAEKLAAEFKVGKATVERNGQNQAVKVTA